MFGGGDQARPLLRSRVDRVARIWMRQAWFSGLD
jgi:hypothetical protein